MWGALCCGEMEREYMLTLQNKQASPMPFERIYEQFYPRVYSYILRKINNTHDAEDMASDIFVYCYHHFSDYDPEKASVATWLYLIVNSRVKNYFRDKKVTVDIQTMENILLAEDPTPVDAVELEEERAVLAQALEMLPATQRKIVILRYFYDKSAPEIARQLGISPGNVRTTLSRALDRLEIYYTKCLEKRRINPNG